MSRILGVLTAVAVCLGALAGVAEAQTVQGEATVTIGQPPPPPVYQQPYPQQPPPPGYGQQPVYGQPVYPGQVYVQPQPVYMPPPQPAQPRVVNREESIAPLWISGVIILPVSYVLTGLAATVSAGDCAFSECRDIDYTLFAWIPLVGPWFMLGQDDSRPLNGDEIAGAVLGGLAQVTGLTLIILGAALKRTVQVTTYSFDESNPRAPRLSFDVTGTGIGATLSHF